MSGSDVVVAFCMSLANISSNSSSELVSPYGSNFRPARVLGVRGDRVQRRLDVRGGLILASPVSW